MTATPSALPRTGRRNGFGHAVDTLTAWCERIPHGVIAFIARFSLAATFWQSGQTKVENFQIDLIRGDVQVGVPRLAESAVDLFRDEYALPLLPPEWAAPLAATAEHVFPLLLLIGLATRFSASALLVMTLVIQLVVYPAAYPTHGLWAALLLYLMARGPGVLSVDHALHGLQARRAGARR
jgi:putative oxidoreductase